MNTIDLTVTTRVPSGKGGARQLRAKGMVPGILYGDGQDSLAVGVQPRDIVDILRSPRGSNSILTIECDGSKHLGFIRDYQVHPVRRKLLHVDLLRVQPETVLKVNVPVNLKGRSKGETRGAKLILAARELKILCAVNEIPESIDIDVTEYEEGFSFYSRDLKLPEGLQLANRGTFPIFSIMTARAILEEEVEEGEDGEGAEGDTPAEGASEAKGE
jgi:large subunit ribosomal protein L25